VQDISGEAFRQLPDQRVEPPSVAVATYGGQGTTRSTLAAQGD